VIEVNQRIGTASRPGFHRDSIVWVKLSHLLPRNTGADRVPLTVVGAQNRRTLLRDYLDLAQDVAGGCSCVGVRPRAPFDVADLGPPLALSRAAFVNEE